MKNSSSIFIIGLIIAALANPVFATDAFQSINLAGTVYANNKTGVSYEARGCIVGLSQIAVKSGNAKKGQILVELDDRATKLAVKTARARVMDLEIALDERYFAITVAKAEVARVKEEQVFVDREFERTRALFLRGLVKETTLELGERRKLEATFAVQRAEEALARSFSAKKRADIALDIGQLELKGRKLDLEGLVVRAPFDGILLNFKPNLGDCVTQGALAAQIYSPAEKSVETFVYVDQLLDSVNPGIFVGNPAKVIRSNGQNCPGIFSLLGTEANLESQNVKAVIELDKACAPNMFLNEAVEIETLPLED